MTSLRVLIGAVRAFPDAQRDVIEVTEGAAGSPTTTVLQGPAPRSEDWEASKAAIKGLYMDQNLNLNEVVDIMKESHNFRATPRMYKAQFAKWGWSKYNCKRLRRDISSGRFIEKSNGKSCRRARRRGGASSEAGHISPSPSTESPVLIKQEEGSSASLVGGMPFVNDAAFSIESILSEIRSHVYGFYTEKRAWKETPETGLISAYNYSFYDSFRISMDNFRKNEHLNGGQILRQAFLEVEEAIQHDYSAVFYFLFIDLPDLFHHYDRQDVLRILLEHINKLANVKLKNKIRGAGFSGLQSLVVNNAAYLRHYIKTASSLWMDLLVQLRGRIDRSTLLAKRNYLRHSRSADRPQMRELVSDYDQLLCEVATVYGAEDNASRQMEDVILHLQFNFDMFLDDFEARSMRLVAAITDKYRHTSGDVVASSNDRPCTAASSAPGSLGVRSWDILDRNIYSNCYERLAAFQHKAGDPRRAAEYRARAEEGWSGHFWHFEAEKALIAARRYFEAETLRKARLESQYFRRLPDTIELMARLPP